MVKIAAMDSPVRNQGGLSAKSKLRFIEATSELMIESRSIDVTFLQIAARAGMNSALIKYHFGNKDGLMTAIVLKAAETKMDALSGLVKTEMSARQKMEIHLFGLINLYWDHPYINSIVNYLIRSAEQQYRDKIEAEILIPFAKLQTELITQGINSGEFKKVDPELIFYLLRGACDSLIDASRNMANAYRVRSLSKDERLRYTRAAIDFLLAGLCT